MTICFALISLIRACVSNEGQLSSIHKGDTLLAESPSIFLEKSGKRKETLLTASRIPIEHAPNSNVTEPGSASLSNYVYFTH